MKYIEVCAGIGGFSHAAEMVNDALGFDFYECAGFSEIEPFCIGELWRKWPHVPQLGRIENVTDELVRAGIRCDAFVGGIPCQPWSIAGEQMGADDERDLWPASLAVIRAAQPRWVCIENVGQFAELALPRVWSDLEGEDYEVGAMEIPACAVGASHERLRTFVVAHREGIGRDTRAGLCSGHAERHGGRLACDCGCERLGVVDNAQCKGLEGCAGAGDGAQGREVTARPVAASGLSWGHGSEGRGVESGMGRAFDESALSGRFDALAYKVIQQQRHPALMGEAQYSWEPPRLAPKGKQWKQQISALGNAIVPVQLFPVLLAIALSDLEAP